MGARDVIGFAGAGWFADPAGSGRMRWWDGSGWTDGFADEDGASPYPPPSPVTGGAPRAAPPVTEMEVARGRGRGRRRADRRRGLVGSPDDDAGTVDTVAGSSTTTTPPTTSSSSSSASPSAVATGTRMQGREAMVALGKLDELDVKGRAPKTGYSRDEFGSRWSDDVDVEGGHNGCDTRNDMLKGLDDVTFKPGTATASFCRARCAIRTPAATSSSCAARSPRPRCRSITSWPCRTPGRRCAETVGRRTPRPRQRPDQPATHRRTHQLAQERR